MRNLFGLVAILMALFLVACDGDPAFTGGTQPPATLPGAPSQVFMGSGVGANFQDGILALSLTTLSAGGNTSVTATIVDGNNNLITDEVSVNFSSPCAAIARASFDVNPVVTTSGAATATYSATGCDGDDNITASALVNGQSLSAMATVTVAPATVGSIQFVSADPTNIGLKGTGGVGRQETSTVRFKVTDSTGGPVSGADVVFGLNTAGGGSIDHQITLTPTSTTSDVQGIVQTVISAGAVATPVRVTATIVSLGIATQSDELTITTGIPDNDSVSLSMVCVNVEGWSRDGETTEVTVRLSDRYNNPVPDGTAVTFNTEGGQIGGSCETVTTSAGGGVCSVTWVSQLPRPPDGRVSIIATAIGEESFRDDNGDGVYNDGDVLSEIGEPFRDDDESTTYTDGEWFGDFNSNSARDGAGSPDYLGFNGLLCEPGGSAVCNANQTLFVSAQGVVVMSSGGAIITDSGAVVVAAGTENVATFTVTVGDVNGNPMAGGTSVSAETSNGSMVGKDSYTFLCDNSNVPTVFNFAVKGDGTTSAGLITIEVTSPSGVVTIRTITFND